MEGWKLAFFDHPNGPVTRDLKKVQYCNCTAISILHIAIAILHFKCNIAFAICNIAHVALAELQSAIFCASSDTEPKL